MTKINCPWKDCKFNQDGICQKTEVDLREPTLSTAVGMDCQDYEVG